MYRILLASSGCYYVQKKRTSGFWVNWHKVGGFFNTRAGARRFIRDHKNYNNGIGNVVEYVG